MDTRGKPKLFRKFPKTKAKWARSKNGPDQTFINTSIHKTGKTIITTNQSNTRVHYWPENPVRVYITGPPLATRDIVHFYPWTEISTETFPDMTQEQLSSMHIVRRCVRFARTGHGRDKKPKQLLIAKSSHNQSEENTWSVYTAKTHSTAAITLVTKTVRRFCTHKWKK